MDFSFYELQVHDGSSWQVKRCFEIHEEADAILEATRMARSTRFGAIRVTLETYDAKRDRFFTKTVYRTTSPETGSAILVSARKPGTDRSRSEDSLYSAKAEASPAPSRAARRDSKSKELIFKIGFKFIAAYALSSIIFLFAYRVAVNQSWLVHDDKSAFIFSPA